VAYLIPLIPLIPYSADNNQPTNLYYIYSCCRDQFKSDKSLNIIMAENEVIKKNQPTCVCKKEGTKVCSSCKTVWYCSRECQQSDWAKHKIECLKLKLERELRTQKLRLEERDQNTQVQQLQDKDQKPLTNEPDNIATQLQQQKITNSESNIITTSSTSSLSNRVSILLYVCDNEGFVNIDSAVVMKDIDPDLTVKQLSATVASNQNHSPERTRLWAKIGGGVNPSKAGYSESLEGYGLLYTDKTLKDYGIIKDGCILMVEKHNNEHWPRHYAASKHFDMDMEVALALSQEEHFDGLGPSPPRNTNTTPTNTAPIASTQPRSPSGAQQQRAQQPTHQQPRQPRPSTGENIGRDQAVRLSPELLQIALDNVSKDMHRRRDIPSSVVGPPRERPNRLPKSAAEQEQEELEQAIKMSMEEEIRKQKEKEEQMNKQKQMDEQIIKQQEDIKQFYEKSLKESREIPMGSSDDSLITEEDYNDLDEAYDQDLDDYDDNENDDDNNDDEDKDQDIEEDE